MMLKNKTIKFKLIFITALSSGIALLVFSIILFAYEITFVKRDLIENIQIQSDIISENSLASLAFMDNVSAERTLQALKYNTDVIYAGLYDNNLQLLAEYKNARLQDNVIVIAEELASTPTFISTKEYAQIITPIKLNGELLGHVVLRSNFDSLNKKLHHYIFILLGLFALTFLIALYLSSQLQRVITRPILYFANFIHDVTDSRIHNTKAVKESEDELGHLIDAFNIMLEQLNLSFKTRDDAQRALSHHLNHLQEIIHEQTLDLQKSLDIADSANRSKSDFLANMSHEIRTPMNAIVGMTHLVKSTQLSEKQRYYINKIDISTQILMSIINDILDYSKIESGKMLLDNTVFLLDDLMVYVIDSVSIKAQQKQIELSFIIGSNVPRHLVGDSLRLGQILLNLVSNAVKFTETGNILVKIELNNQIENRVDLHFSVSDTGIGLSPQQIDRLFQPFSQADSSITRKYGGTGLGLSICKQLAELMNSEIHITSIEGKGSVFSFDLILSIAPEKLMDTNSMIKHTDTTSPHYKLQRVLLVEDNEINREVAIELLTSMNLEVIIASNGQEGLELAKNKHFDLILMDIQMPVMDGITATQLIRAEKSLQSIPIIAMTANALTSDYEKSIAAGMNDHLSKPIEMEKLITTLNRWLRIDISMKNAPKMHNTSFPNTLEPFNLEKAAQLTNENNELLHHLLLSFAKRYQDAPRQLRQFIDTKNFTEIEHVAHSIKGVAGTLAAQELKEAASALEIAVRDHRYDLIDDLVNRLVIELNPAIEATKSLPALPSVVKETDMNLSVNELNVLLTEFRAALNTKQLKALEIFSKLEPYLLQHGLRQEVQEFNDCLEKLDFQRALPILDRCLLSSKEK